MQRSRISTFHLMTAALFAASLLVVVAMTGNAVAADRCTALIGSWVAHGERTAVASPEGGVTITNASGGVQRGRWHCMDAETGTVQMTWAGGLVKTKVVVAPGGRSATSINMLGQQFTWHRIGAAAAPPAARRAAKTVRRAPTRAPVAEPVVRDLSSVGGPSEPASIKPRGPDGPKR